eukprot:COSAG04_NODE_12482_length_650_cov_1.760436_1_plen_75_part_10
MRKEGSFEPRELLSGLAAAGEAAFGRPASWPSGTVSLRPSDTAEPEKPVHDPRELKVSLHPEQNAFRIILTNLVP